MEKRSYDTLVEAINDLTKKGYTSNLNVKFGCIVCSTVGTNVETDEFVIDAFYRFEGNSSSPDDNCILYAISSEKHGLKGLLVNAYGIYSDDYTDALIEKLNI